MVAIPTYLLASTAVSSLHSLSALTSSVVPRSADPAPAPEVIPSPGQFSSIDGPVMQNNFPDPCIIYHDGISYAFATNNRGVGDQLIHIQMATSTDNATWSLLEHEDALPTMAPWETGDKVWAPDVVQLDDGSFVMYYTDALVSAPLHHCVGAATSKTITGPYTPLETPLACPDPTTLGGAIDPDGFWDPSTGKRYVTYKVDGNSIGHGGLCMNSVAPIVPTPIMLQEVGPDGITLIGEARQILDRDELDGPLIEAPSLHRSDEGIYFLFFSSNCFTTPMYDTSYATATNIWGPYTKSRRPLFVTGDGPDLIGPGGTDIIKGGNTIVFHGHLTAENCRFPADSRMFTHHTLIRGMYSAWATFSDTTVSLTGATPGKRQY